ncbi:MAG: hypothetical protein RMJ53_03125 [Chitinophagales bacterium]|nr:hypothetical protein [Chitinophagales bacterium]MDW8273203.1 hypothetical protein [Chitinophagales bacterium]
MFRSFLFVATVATLFTVSSCTKECDEGYEGNDCKTEIREKYLGSWTAEDDCVKNTTTNQPVPYTVINKKAGSVTQFEITNVANAGVTVVATVNTETTFTIDKQTVKVGTANVEVTGNGTISADKKTVTATYTVTGSGGAQSCSVKLTR